MTFDLHYPNDKKAAAYRMWVQRVYTVANILELSYLEMWELPEQEFLVLEEMAQEIQKKRLEQKQQLIAQQGNRNGR